jgi:hypothetical protein
MQCREYGGAVYPLYTRHTVSGGRPYTHARLCSLKWPGPAGLLPLTDPAVSPLLGDVGGLPRTLVAVGQCELLYDQALSLSLSLYIYIYIYMRERERERPHDQALARSRIPPLALALSPSLSPSRSHSLNLFALLHFFRVWACVRALMRVCAYVPRQDAPDGDQERDSDRDQELDSDGVQVRDSDRTPPASAGLRKCRFPDGRVRVRVRVRVRACVRALCVGVCVCV